MSSTSVHSNNEAIFCAGAQVVPTERHVDIPPKSAKRGPSVLNVIHGDNMEINVGKSTLKKDGKLIAEDGTQIAKFDKNAFVRISSKHNKKQKATRDMSR